MGVFLRRSLALLTGLLLALPPGWCCFVPAAPCRPAQRGEGAPKKSSGHAHCCCPEGRAPAGHQHAPAPATPSKPVKSCCLENPSIAPDTARPLADLAAHPLPLPVDLPAAPRPAVAPPGPVFVVSPPSLNLLHCVWLC